MIKTSGYRVSPTEVEEVVYGSGLVDEAAALGVPHPTLGQAILLVVTASKSIEKDAIIRHCQRELPNFMLPQEIIFQDGLPRNQNGKMDRKSLASSFQHIFLKESR